MRHIVLALIALVTVPSLAAAQSPPADPFIWLESVSSAQSMDWVRSHNAVTEKALQADPLYSTLYREALTVASTKDRIPMPSFVHGQIYNFWQDAQHLRGLWRKTSLADYQAPNPQWTTVLDIDALGKSEGKSWVLKDIDCLRPAERLCLVSLSNGGEDAVEIREFDLDTDSFVPGGFHLPRGKHRVAWEDADHLLVATKWAPGDVTGSGYPYIVKRLTRGQAVAEAVEVFRGSKSDGGYGVSPAVLMDGEGHRLEIIDRPLDTFRHEIWVITPKGVVRLAIPPKAEVEALVDNRVIVRVDDAWTVNGTTFAPGSLAQLDLNAVETDPSRLSPSLIWAPGPRESLDDVSATKDTLLVSTLDNVRGRAFVFTPTTGGGWTRTRLDLPDNLSVGLAAADHNSDRAFVSTSGFLTPTTLWLADAATAALTKTKALPAQFDASHDVVEQLQATSTDGTRIPYFLVRPKDMKFDGTTPTLMTAYGGFQVSKTPYYSATIGKLWLERGGAFVLANIRGGGEFGPAWHEAGLGVKRQIVYDDFASVAENLVARRITSPRRLGIEGGSNGGLLMGVEFIQHPKLWRAVVIEVPLLDMIRISKIAAGASWEGEYGDVNTDPAAMAFWLKTSPYQNLRAGVDYPEPFIFTTTKDDRVGPQHARKFAAKMQALGLPFYYYENTEGGHAAGADIKQAAHTTALTMTYLHEKLMN